MKTTNMGIRLAFDIETNGLLNDLTKVHCIAISNLDIDNTYTYKPDELEQALTHLDTADELWGHNIVDFDLPALEKVYNWKPNCTVRDTLLLSRMIWSNMSDRDYSKTPKDMSPRLYGSHSLKAWGYRLGEYKGDYSGGWDEWNDEMHQYANQDAIVTKKLVELILSKNPSQDAVELTHKLANVCQQIKKNGWKFDLDKAYKLLAELTEKRENIRSELDTLFENWYEFLEERTPKVNARNKTKGIPFSAVKLKVFNPSSRQHIANRLTSKYGWKPKLFTANGSPKIDESVLSTLEYPEAQKMAEYFLLEKRLAMLSAGNQSWLNHEKGGYIHHDIVVNSCISQRASHQNPNLGQVPAVRAAYGKQIRDLFTVKDGFVLVGSDLSGLELRCLAHYLSPYDGGEYGKILLEGDIHTVTQKALGLETRDLAKTFLYALIYSAGVVRLGEIVGGGAKEGSVLRDRFFRQYPAFKRLRNDVLKAAERGFLKGLDGRILNVRSAFSSLNLLLQSAGAILCSKWVVLMDEDMKRAGYEHGWNGDYATTGWIHDEIQMATKKEIAEDVGNRFQRTAKEAGETFSFRCKIEAEYKIGKTWSDTH